MAYLNKVMLIGNVGKDPVVSATASGKKRMTFSIATSRRYKENNGETKEQTDWHNIVGWGKVCEVFEQLGVKKGTTLYVEGSITNRSWTENTTGLKKNVTEINLENFQVLTPRNSNGNISTATAPAASAPVYDAEMVEDENGLPF